VEVVLAMEVVFSLDVPSSDHGGSFFLAGSFDHGGSFDNVGSFCLGGSFDHGVV